MSRILGANGKPMRLAAEMHTTPTTDRTAKPIHVCDDPNDAIRIAEFIVFEMQNNPYTPEGLKITRANSYDVGDEMLQWRDQPWYARLGPPPDFMALAAGHKSAAYAWWAERVGPGCWWDHKWRIKEWLIRQGGEKAFNRGWHKYGQYDYFYDIWSNIHYGYVGMAVGFSSAELINGAGVAQAGHDAVRAIGALKRPTMQQHPENGPWPASADDVPDHISIMLGIDLYKEVRPAKLTVDRLLRKISSVPAPWGKGDDKAKELHQCHRG